VVFSIAVHTTLFVRVSGYACDFTRGLTSVCRRRGLKSRPTLVMFILNVLSFIAATIYWTAWIAAVIIKIRLVLVTNDGMELAEKNALASAAIAKPDLLEIFFMPFVVS
jgi:hypothetical protein